VGNHSTSSLDDLVNSIAPQWRRDFQSFIDTGEATEAFQQYMDSDAQCQAAVERAFTIKTEGLVGLAQALSQGSESAEEGMATDEWVSSRVTTALVQVLTLPSVERAKASRRTADRLKEKVAKDQQRDIASFLGSLEGSLDQG
jgi:hypothetical protein